MMNLWQTLVQCCIDYVWVLQIFAIVLVTAIIHFIETRLYRKLIPRIERSKNMWDDAFAHALHKPFVVLIWVLGISLALEIVGVKAHEPIIFKYVVPAKKVIIVVLLVWFLVRFVTNIEAHFISHRKKQQKHVDETTVHALFQLLRLTVIITAILVGMQTIGIPISGVIAFGGVGGLAVGFAAKDLLANFFGGLMIFLDRPFSVGDWIRSPDRQIEGTVEHIGWRLTRIRTFDKRPLYVPNGAFSTISVENPTRMKNRRIKAVVGVRYDDASKVKIITDDIQAMLAEHAEIDQQTTTYVKLFEFAASSLNIMVYTFTKTTDWVTFQAIQQDVFLKIIEIIEKHGAECAFPTRTVHVPAGVQVSQ